GDKSSIRAIVGEVGGGSTPPRRQRPDESSSRRWAQRSPERQRPGARDAALGGAHLATPGLEPPGRWPALGRLASARARGSQPADRAPGGTARHLVRAGGAALSSAGRRR